MSDFNISAGQVPPSRPPSASEVRRESAQPVGQVLDTATNEVTSATAQVNPVDENETGNRSREQEERDPLDRAAEALQNLISENELDNTKLQINRDEASDRFIYQSVDNDTGEVVRQFPQEEVLRMLANIRDPEGIAVDQQA